VIRFRDRAPSAWFSKALGWRAGGDAHTSAERDSRRGPRALIDRQFPAWRDLPVEPVPQQGGAAGGLRRRDRARRYCRSCTCATGQRRTFPRWLPCSSGSITATVTRPSGPPTLGVGSRPGTSTARGSCRSTQPWLVTSRLADHRRNRAAHYGWPQRTGRSSSSLRSPGCSRSLASGAPPSEGCCSTGPCTLPTNKAPGRFSTYVETADPMLFTCTRQPAGTCWYRPRSTRPRAGPAIRLLDRSRALAGDPGLCLLSASAGASTRVRRGAAVVVVLPIPRD
jgi:hypothetical protein